MTAFDFLTSCKNITEVKYLYPNPDEMSPSLIFLTNPDDALEGETYVAMIEDDKWVQKLFSCGTQETRIRELEQQVVDLQKQIDRIKHFS